MGMQSTERESGSTPCSWASLVVCTSAASPVRATRPRIPTPSGMRLPRALAVMPASALISISLVDVVENADADVIEAEILLDVADDVRQHLLGILAGNGGLRNVVEERQLAGAPLLLGEQPGIFHRDRNLAGRGLHDFQIALLEDVFALRVQWPP